MAVKLQIPCSQNKKRRCSDKTVWDLVLENGLWGPAACSPPLPHPPPGPGRPGGEGAAWAPDGSGTGEKGLLSKRGKQR